LERTGFDACTTASNHSVDQGYVGLRRTLDVLDRVGLAHAGTARSPVESRRVVTLTANGLTVALLAYTYGTNGMPVERAWSVNLIDPSVIRRDARLARRSGADAVVVALHYGDEYRNAPSSYQLAVAGQVTRSPYVDLVVGHHAHVVQPVRRVNGTWVAFGLGNLVAQQDTRVPGVYEGMAVVFDLVRDAGRLRVRFVGHRPTAISVYDASDPAMRVYDVVAALGREGLPAERRAWLQAVRDRVSAVVGRRIAPSQAD
jgi:poly-gamma-glutamate synthesis protein (capsule biosynthesis protein)